MTWVTRREVNQSFQNNQLSWRCLLIACKHKAGNPKRGKPAFLLLSLELDKESMLHKRIFSISYIRIVY